MQMLKTLTAASYQDLIDYNVVDVNENHVGTLHSLWSDQDSGEIEFLGVKTGWLFGRNHVVPAAEAQIDAEEKYVKIPFAAEFIRNAPSIDADSEINEVQERDIFRYYASASQRRNAGEIASRPTATASDTAVEDVESDMARALGVTAAAGSTSGVAEPLPTTTAGSGAEAKLSGDSPVGDAGAGGRLRRTGSVAPTATNPPGGVLPGATNSGGALGLDTSNPDPLTGEPGAHPVGTGIGAASGAATGAAMGAAGGPVGAVIGGIAGAVVGGLIGKGVEEYFDPTAETAYWKSNYRSTAYYDPTRTFEEFEPAYRAGFEGFGRVVKAGRAPGDFTTVEEELRRDYESSKATGAGQAGGLEWERAKHAARDAYERVRANVAKRQPPR
jgi:hypothetical protein